MVMLVLPTPPDPKDFQFDGWAKAIFAFLKDMESKISLFVAKANPLYVLALNGVMTGVPVAPTAAQGTSTTQIATTAFVTSSPQFTGVPIAPTAAQGTSTTQLATTAFVTASPQFTGTPIAPTAAALTNTTQLATTAFVTAAVAAEQVLTTDVGRNYFHNGQFRVQQRGTGSFTTTTAYNADRWLTNAVNGTRTVTIASLADADRTAIADEEAQYGVNYIFAGGSSAGDFEVLCQKIENVRRTANKTVTVSFWAKAASGTPKIGLNWTQVFGTGGSPSANVTGTAQSVTISTTFARYTATFAVSSASAKTFGSTANTDYLQFNFWLSSGSTNNTQAGSIGVQSATIAFWGMQLEVASVASELEKSDYRYDLANCQRFYVVGRIDMQDGAYTIGVTTFGKADFPVTMRASPTVTSLAGGANVNVTGATVGALSNTGAFCSGTATAAGNWNIFQNYTASADL